MSVQLTAESERLVQEAIGRGDFHSVDEIIAEGVKHPINSPALRKPRQNLADFLMQSPLAGSEIDLERQQDCGRPIDL